MSTKEIREEFSRNQIRINNLCYLLAIAGLGTSIGLIVTRTIEYSLITMGIAMLSWFFSLVYGFKYLISKGNYLAAAEYATKDDPVNIIDFKAPQFLRRQYKLLIVGCVFFALWLVWKLINNTYPAFPS